MKEPKARKRDTLEEVKQVIARMKEALSTPGDGDLAERLGVSVSALSMWKKRRKVPESASLRAALFSGRSVKWIMTGVADKRDTLGEAQPALDTDLLALALHSVVQLARGARDVPLTRASAQGLAEGCELTYRRYAALWAAAQDKMNKADFLEAMWDTRP